MYVQNVSNDPYILLLNSIIKIRYSLKVGDMKVFKVFTVIFGANLHRKPFPPNFEPFNRFEF